MEVHGQKIWGRRDAFVKSRLGSTFRMHPGVRPHDPPEHLRTVYVITVINIIIIISSRARRRKQEQSKCRSGGRTRFETFTFRTTRTILAYYNSGFFFCLRYSRVLLNEDDYSESLKTVETVVSISTATGLLIEPNQTCGRISVLIGESSDSLCFSNERTLMQFRRRDCLEWNRWSLTYVDVKQPNIRYSQKKISKKTPVEILVVTDVTNCAVFELGGNAQGSRGDSKINEATRFVAVK